MKKLKAKLSSAAQLAKSLLKECAKLGLVAALVLSLAGLVALAPQIHRSYLRNKVGSRVVKIVKLDEKGRVRGGGTGFAIKAPSGENYLLTNAHVCEAFKGSPEIKAQLPDGTIIPRRILEISENTDLCLAEGLPGVEGLSVADDAPKKGQIVNVVGHPRLKPLTLSMGELIGLQEVSILAGLIGDGSQEAKDAGWLTEEDCQKPKNKIMEFETIFGTIKACMISVLAYQTSAVALPGNSGSPAVDMWGNVVGVLFAGDSEVHWGMLVTLKDVKDFLKVY